MPRARRKQPTLDEIMRVLQENLPRLRREYAVHGLSVFGSFVRGEQRSRSDLDVLVEYDETPGLIELIRLQYHLSDLVGVKVDLVSHGGLRGRIGERILQESVPV